MHPTSYIGWDFVGKVSMIWMLVTRLCLHVVVILATILAVEVMVVWKNPDVFHRNVSAGASPFLSAVQWSFHHISWWATQTHFDEPVQNWQIAFISWNFYVITKHKLWNRFCCRDAALLAPHLFLICQNSGAKFSSVHDTRPSRSFPIGTMSGRSHLSGDSSPTTLKLYSLQNKLWIPFFVVETPPCWHHILFWIFL